MPETYESHVTPAPEDKKRDSSQVSFALILQLRRDPFAVVRFASHGIVSQAPVCPSEQ